MTNKLFKNIIAFIMILTFNLSLISCKQVNTRKFDVNTLKKISNLSTLECHFKNVSSYSKSGIRGLERQLLEYTVTINVGIDMSKITYDEMTKTLTIPKPKVISKNYDADSINSVTDQFRFFSNLKVEEAQEEISKSLDELVMEVENNSSIMNRAQSLTVTQIDALVKNMFNTSIGLNYSFE